MTLWSLFLAMSSPGDVPSPQYYRDLNTPLTAVIIKQLLKNDSRSRRPKRCLTNVVRLVGFICLMSGISYAKVNVLKSFSTKWNEVSKFSFFRRLAKVRMWHVIVQHVSAPLLPPPFLLLARLQKSLLLALLPHQLVWLQPKLRGWWIRQLTLTKSRPMMGLCTCFGNKGLPLMMLR